MKKAHPALRIGLVAHLEVRDGAAAVAVHHAAADLPVPVTVRSTPSAGAVTPPLPWAETGAAEHLQLVRLTRRQALQQERSVGTGRVLAAVHSRPERRAAALARAARGDVPAGSAVAELVVEDAADRRAPA
jgi:hypothetical protein